MSHLLQTLKDTIAKTNNNRAFATTNLLNIQTITNQNSSMTYVDFQTSSIELDIYFSNILNNNLIVF
jgi:hypothetical protein